MFVVETPLYRKQVRQVVMNPKQVVAVAGGGCNSKGYLETVDGLPRIALGVIYLAKSAVTSAEIKLFAFLREEFDCVDCGLFCGVELFV